MEIISGGLFGVAEDPWGADPNVDLVGRQAKLLAEGLLFGFSVACVAPGVLVVRVVGELDMVTVPLLHKCLREQSAEGPAHLVVDLETVGFMGSAGLNTLLAVRERAQAAGSVLYLTGMKNRAVVRPLEVTGLLPLFDLYPTLADVLGELKSERGGAGQWSY